MPKGDVPELVAAAQTIENDQKRLEELARALQKTKLQTEKNINRAARELQEALGQQESLAVSLQALGQAMVRMRGAPASGRQCAERASDGRSQTQSDASLGST